ncbi:MAG TPA: cation:dicarboxylase symporter family transporter [Spirochaetota bacterium]|nr:cation:dicarboxylase symporter family transporter [Spirochaetota bacterium]
MNLKNSLIFKLFLGIITGILLGITLSHYNIDFLLRTIKTAEILFGAFLKFIIPLIIIGFVPPGIIDIGGKAGKTLIITILLAVSSTLIGGLVAYSTGTVFLESLVGNLTAPAETLTIEPLFSLKVEPPLPVFTALALAFVFGLVLASKPLVTFRNVFYELKDIVEILIRKAIIPLLPFYIASLFCSLSATGEIIPILTSFGKLYVVIIGLQISIVIVEYIIAGVLTRRNPLHLIKNMIPAYLTAFGTQSSAATIPVTIESVRSNDVSEDIIDFVIPLCATIHLVGDMIMITLSSMVILTMQGGTPELVQYIPFIFLLSVTMIAAPGIPGGGAMTALGLLEEMLLFNNFQKGLILSLHMAQDSFGTASNVSGDGALTIIIDYITGKMKK